MKKANTYLLRTTPTHPFWVEGKGWIDAGYLVAGDKLRLYNGELLEVEKVEVEFLDEAIKVYNFEVEDWHTYFVSVSEVLVHNRCKIEEPSKVDFTDKGVRHVNERHIKDKPEWSHKSKWTLQNGEWKTRTRETFRHPDRVSIDGDRFIYEKEFKKPVGVDANGNDLFKVRVVLERNGELVTSFPQADWR